MQKKRCFKKAFVTKKMYQNLKLNIQVDIYEICAE